MSRMQIDLSLQSSWDCLSGLVNAANNKFATKLCIHRALL